MLLMTWIGNFIPPEFQFFAMFDNWIALCYQIKLSLLRIMNPDLMGTDMYLTILGTVDETSSADTTHIYMTIVYIFDVQTLYQKW